MSAEHHSESTQPSTDPESLLALKDTILTTWEQLPPEHQATMALVLLDSVKKGEWELWAREAINTFWPEENELFSLVDVSEGVESEILDHRHFYAAYIFDKAEAREQDITTVIEMTKELGHRMRYWWLSDAMPLQGYPDRLIVCVHHPSSSEDAGMDFYDALKEKGATWDELEAATVDEYHHLGKPVEGLESVSQPGGDPLFPKEKSPEPHVKKEEVLFEITDEDVREVARVHLGRELSDDELNVVTQKFSKALEWMDWSLYLEEAIRACKMDGKIGQDVGEQNQNDVNVDRPDLGASSG